MERVQTEGREEGYWERQGHQSHMDHLDQKTMASSTGTGDAERPAAPHASPPSACG
eukprot:EC791197.1.p5 GENE.EC791197.1~~EC791197.1.p5  ORF type:complete len:56 (-),score=8.17 EC791197.1:91-258(-)